MYKFLIGFLGLSTIGLLASTITLASNKGTSSSEAASVPAGTDFLESKVSSVFFATEEDNVCAGAKLAFENKLCADLEVAAPIGANPGDGGATLLHRTQLATW